VKKPTALQLDVLL